MMETKRNFATMRAMAIATTLVEVALVAATVYQLFAGSAIPLAIFGVLAFFNLFWTAALWGADLDNRRNSSDDDAPEMSPNETHDLVEVDYANLLRRSHSRRLVITLRCEEPYAVIEAVGDDYHSDWMVEGTTMFETYVKAWIKASNDERNTAN